MFDNIMDVLYLHRRTHAIAALAVIFFLPAIVHRPTLNKMYGDVYIDRKTIT